MNTVYESKLETIEHVAEMERLKLNSERLYNRIDVDQLSEKIQQARIDRWYFLFTGIAFGSLVAAIVFHYWK